MSPWQSYGLHQHPKFLSFNFYNFFVKLDWFFILLTMYYLYFYITCSLDPSLPILYGLAKSDDSVGNRLPSMKTTPFLPMYTLPSSYIHSFRLLCFGRRFPTFTLTTDIILFLHYKGVKIYL